MFFVILLVLIAVGFYYALFYKKNTKPVIVPVVVNDEKLSTDILFYRNLDKTSQVQFRKEIEEFLQHVAITGVNTIVTDKDRVLVASSAIIPMFAFPEWNYPNLKEVLLYSDAINMNFESEGNNDRNILGMVGSGDLEGKMLLSKHALQLGFSNKTDKNNTAIHEFVHLIDKVDGDVDGVPRLLMDKQYVLPWLELIHAEMKRIQQDRSDINPYGLTNKSEFFAVAAEYFFERPDLFSKKHPELFEMMQMIFKKK